MLGVIPPLARRLLGRNPIYGPSTAGVSTTMYAQEKVVYTVTYASTARVSIRRHPVQLSPRAGVAKRSHTPPCRLSVLLHSLGRARLSL
jgi:hypothetical protein